MVGPPHIARTKQSTRDEYQAGKNGTCRIVLASFAFLFADGSVRFLSYGIAPLMPALASRAGNDPVTIPG